jgi:hypothetical protein
MFQIDAIGFYSREDLKRELGGLMAVSTFLRPLRPYLRSLYRQAYWGGELIEAIERARLAAAESAARPEIEIRQRGGKARKRNRLDPSVYIDREERTA